MGDPRKQKKKYDPPRKMWDQKRVEKRRHLTDFYGLQNKKEIWKAESFLRKKRQTARKLLALDTEKRKKREKELLTSLIKLGALKKSASLDDVLSLKTEAVLDRRLQTVVWKQGLSATPKQARQLITHGHIGINGKKVDVPSYLVKKSEEDNVDFINSVVGVKIKRTLKERRKKKRKKKPTPKPKEKKEKTKKKKKEESEEKEKESKEKKEKEQKESKKGVEEKKEKKEEKAESKKKGREKRKQEKPQKKEEKSEGKKKGKKKKGEGK